ncbi:iron transporter [Methylobacterium sp. J-030]|uniref:iron transporter n=1 Tax=Methylobacterium sp. J-030 TaxID=2836627 RepID=UPI001FBB702C|nr:iron transporter [Methylobacterium sp. J-030]MCJ2070241.1 iron transporter [Methylobacterium sp. J-030]
MSAGQVSADRGSAHASATRAYRLSVAARVLLAAGGGYAIAALASALLPLILPVTRAEAVSAAMITSFAIMAAAVIWVFAARTVGRAALVLGLVAALLTVALWLAGAVQAGASA